MSAAQWFILGVLVTVGTIALGSIALELAKDACREHYRRAGIRFDAHVDDALKVARR